MLNDKKKKNACTQGDESTRSFAGGGYGSMQAVYWTEPHFSKLEESFCLNTRAF